MLKRLRKQLSTDLPGGTPTKEELRQRIHNAEVDLNYAQYYPLSKAYPSLYPKSKKKRNRKVDSGIEDEATHQQADEEFDGPKGDIEMWKAIEQAMVEGGLDKIRNSVAHLLVAIPKEDTHKKEKKKQKVKKNLVVQENTDFPPIREEAEESDGGFFE